MLRILGGFLTTKPDGKLSVKPIPVSALAEELIIVTVSVEVPFGAIVVGENDF